MNTVAPELEGGVAWLNTDKPLRLADLKGQVVILDFWTYCCANCMHVLPMLAALEERHAEDPVAVIGIHSAKFDAERAPDQVRAAVQRYEVRHPVLVDSLMAVWRRYGVRSWPTLVFIRPDGRIAGTAPGEPDPQALEDLVVQLLDDGRRDGSLAPGPVLARKEPRPGTLPLRFPGKVHAAPDGRIFVSDSGHHRVLVLGPDGSFLDAIGSGLRGRRDGRFESAAFDDPQGLALDPDGLGLYVADARGHVIVRADLEARTVRTIAGTGELGAMPLGGAEPARLTALRSPWDVAVLGRRLLFASAGSHQIGVLDLDRRTVERFAGSGREALHDGSAEEAAFAQPCGLWLDAETGRLYVADSETSAVRCVDLERHRTATLTGTGLFDWSDGDGKAAGAAPLQHVQAVAMTPRGLVVADTFNSQLKLFSPDLAALERLPSEAGGLTLWEPGGLAVETDGSVLVADTNRHRLLRLDPEGKQLAVLEVVGAPAARAGVLPAAQSDGEVEPALMELPTARLQKDMAATIVLGAPPGYEITRGSVLVLSLWAEDGPELFSATGHAAGGTRAEFAFGPLTLESPAEGEGPALIAQVRGMLCDTHDHRACFPLEARYRIPVEWAEQGEPLLLPLGTPASDGSSG